MLVPHLGLISIMTLSAAPATVYISASGSGVYRASFDSETGKLGKPQLAADFGAASWIAPHPSLPILYTSLREPGKDGIVSWTIEPSGDLTRQSEVLLEVGSPTHIAVHPEGTLVATSHYGGGAGTLMALEADGFLKGPAVVTPHTIDQPGPWPQQDQPRPHFVAFTADGGKIHQVDLGTDAIWTWDITADPPAQEFSHKVTLPAGYGPRHLAVHPTLPYAYVSDELGSKISVFRYDRSTAILDPVQHLNSMDPQDVAPGNNTSHILIHPNGRFVYIGNRGDDSIGVFSIDPDTGVVAFVETEPVRGHWPRGFAIDPDGRWLIVAGQYSDTVGVMEIDPDTGRLSFAYNNMINLPNPVCVVVR